jgi:hypothetical protein
VSADASPVEWEKVVNVPLDTNENVSMVLLGAPSFSKIEDVLAGNLSFFCIKSEITSA